MLLASTPCDAKCMMHLQAVDLTKIDLSHNSLTELPAQLWDLSALVTLLARFVRGLHMESCI